MQRPCGPTDKASHYESGDSRFESWQGRCYLFSFIVTDLVVTLLFEHASLTAMLPKGIRHLTTKEGIPASSTDGFAVTLLSSLLPILVVKLVFEHSNLTALWPNG